MPPRKIMLIRHGEKPEPPGANGVDRNGKPDPRSLTPIGWERAAKLVAFFADPHDPIETPLTIFAAKPTADSQRPLETVSLVAKDRFGSPDSGPKFNAGIDQDDFDGIAKALSAATEDVVLVCWEHKAIPNVAVALLKALQAPQDVVTPDHWPGHRFDVVWIFERKEGVWIFAQTHEGLMPDDEDKPIE